MAVKARKAIGQKMNSWKWSAVAALALLSLAPAAAQPNPQPTMFVEDEPGLAWWLRLKLVPASTSDEGVSLTQINNFIRARLDDSVVGSPAASFIPLCYMNFAHTSDVVSSDRDVQLEIASTFREFPNSFSETLTVGTEEFRLRVGIFEHCTSGTSGASEAPFMALVIIDGSGAIREFDAMAWPFIRLYKTADDKINVYGCFACGEVQRLAYNPVDREFYFNWIGH